MEWYNSMYAARNLTWKILPQLGIRTCCLMQLVKQSANTASFT